MSDSYHFGRITIDGKTYHSDVIVYPHRVDDTWRRKKGHHLCLNDVHGILGKEPETLVVGTGYFGRMIIDPDVHDACKKRNIDVIATHTSKAWEAFSRLKDSRKVIADLHLTC